MREYIYTSMYVCTWVSNKSMESIGLELLELLESKSNQSINQSAYSLFMIYLPIQPIIYHPHLLHHHHHSI